MKNTLLILSSAVALAISVLAPSALAEPINHNVHMAEAAFGCKGLNADLSVTPAINLEAEQLGELRIPMPSAQMFQLSDNKIMFIAPDASLIEIGQLTSVSPCEQIDAGELPHSTWNIVELSKTVSLTLLISENGTTLTITNLKTNKSYSISL